MAFEKNDWSEYSKLVLTQLKELKEGQKQMQEDIDRRLDELHQKVSLIQTFERDIETIKTWKERVSDVWSPVQMREIKMEVTKQKENWSKSIGIVIGIQVIFAFLMSLLKIFK